MKYEMMIIYKNNLGEEGAKDMSKKVSDLINSLGAKVTENNYWGRRKFAYEIKHDSEGFYDVFVFESESSIIKILKEKLNILSGLVRYLITVQK